MLESALVVYFLLLYAAQVWTSGETYIESFPPIRWRRDVWFSLKDNKPSRLFKLLVFKLYVQSLQIVTSLVAEKKPHFLGGTPPSTPPPADWDDMAAKEGRFCC